MDPNPHNFANLGPIKQNDAGQTDPDPKHWSKVNLLFKCCVLIKYKINVSDLSTKC